MIDEEVRGWRSPPTSTRGEGGAGTTAYQAWRMREIEGGVGLKGKELLWVGSIEDRLQLSHVFTMYGFSPRSQQQ